MNRRLALSLFYLAAVLAALTAGPRTAFAEIGKSALWRDAVATDLDVDFGAGFHARWRFHRCDCGDLRVMVEQVAPDDTLTGELLMVDGQALLARGFQQQGEDIEPLVQAPSLMLQLAYSMLNRVQPKGPGAVEGKQAWNETEKRTDFSIDTGLATGNFAAPWKIKGSGWEAGPDHIRFELVFEFTSPGPETETGSMSFSGDLDFGKQEFPYSDDTGLEGWRLQWISLNETRSVPAEKGLTLGALREKAKKP